MLINGYDVGVRAVVKFKTKHATESGIWYTGVISSLCSYDVARMISDVVAYHQSVKTVDPAISDVTLEDFFILKLANGTSMAFSDEWINEVTFEKIDEGAVRNIALYNVTSEQADQAVAALQDLGIPCKRV